MRFAIACAFERDLRLVRPFRSETQSTKTTVLAGWEPGADIFRNLRSTTGFLPRGAAGIARSRAAVAGVNIAGKARANRVRITVACGSATWTWPLDPARAQVCCAAADNSEVVCRVVALAGSSGNPTQCREKKHDRAEYLCIAHGSFGLPRRPRFLYFLL